MLAPKISLRQLLWWMVAVAAFLAMVSTAWRGNLVTFGQSLAIVSLPVVFLIYAMVYWLLYAIASRFQRRRTPSPGLSYSHVDAYSTPEVPEPKK